jgi:hypothetical protein
MSPPAHQSLFLKGSLDRFKSTQVQISEWLLIQLRAAGGTLELLAIKPSEGFLKLLATAEAFSREGDFTHGSLGVSKCFSRRINVGHERNS